jgi:TonB family protein
MKKIILTLAVLCCIGLMAGCTDVPPKDTPTDTGLFPYDMFLFVEHEPEFYGDTDSLYAFLNKNVSYPKEAIEKKIEGTVFVRFVVERNGSITNAQVMRDIVYGSEEADSLAIELGCGAEVLRLVSMMPKWKPAVHYGDTVRYQYNLPVKFSLKDGIVPPSPNRKI